MSANLPPAEEAPRLAQVGLWFLLAGAGGAVKYLSSVLRGGEAVGNRRFVTLLTANILISSFCGLMGGLLVSTLTPDQTWHYLACGLFGYVGTQGLDYLMLALKRKIEPGLPVSAVFPVPPPVAVTEEQGR